MKMMDINEQDDCIIEAVTPAKKKKMKQAQLPFHTQSPIQLQNSSQSKKRKLTSPSVINRSSKAVKISNRKSSKDIADNKLNDDAKSKAKESSKDMEIIKDIESENVKENTTSNEVEGKNKIRRSLTGQKKLDLKDKVKLSPLTKFLKKTDKNEESLESACQNLIQDKKDEQIITTPKGKPVKKGTLLNSNSSSHHSDTDITILSSNDEDMEEQTKSKGNIEKSTKTDKPIILKSLKLELMKLPLNCCSNSDIVIPSNNKDKKEHAKSNENIEVSTRIDSRETRKLERLESSDDEDKEKQTTSKETIEKSTKTGNPKILKALKLELVKSPSLSRHSNSDIAMSSDNEDGKERTTSIENIEKSPKTDSPATLKLKMANRSSLSCNSDSDIVTMSSDCENKEKQTKSNESMEGSIEISSPSALKTPKNDKPKQSKISPKQREKKLLSAKKKEERERLKMEKEKRLEEERQNRLREKEEKRREKEEKRKEKEEKEKAEKEQKLMEKKIKDQKKQMEMEQKQKEKQAKDEERKKREEEKRKKEEEKLEAERRKQKAASNFTSFFVAKKQEKSVEEETTTEAKYFMPFEVKADMKLAPICRRALNEQEKSSLDEKHDKGDAGKSDLYISEIKSKKLVPRKSTKTWPFEAKDDVVILDEETDGISNIVKQSIDIEKQRTKLLQFSENRRPPYRGTWRKQSRSINPRKPFSKDTKWFNYDVDSDEEWDEEEPGESLHGSDDERNEENPDDNEYDVDNEFMVPHGYLSDEELRADDEEKIDMSPETQKFKLKALGEQFETERKTQTSRLEPKIIGCVWRGPENTFLGNIPQRTMDFLSAHEVWVRQVPVTLQTSNENEAANECGAFTSSASASKRKVPDKALPQLIRLTHGNTYSTKFLVREFMSYWSKENNKNQISKSNLFRKIREIGKWMACPEEGPMYQKSCWYVPENIRKKYLSEDLPLPNRWSYNLVPPRKSDVAEAADKLEKDEKKNSPLITQFTKRITQEEMKKQLTFKSAGTSSQSKLSQTKTPKRATLISVGRGEQFSKRSKKSLFAKTLSDANTASKNEDDDEVVIIEECSANERPENQSASERVESGKKESEDTIGTVSMECESGVKNENESTYGRQGKGNDETLKCNTHAEDAKEETIVDSMDIVDDDPEQN
ncbi:chromatin assembly factor 1 subunit A-like [Colletes gigas]|uniref:chromatin assembly factor 1 subunit A-like n=1 Tax=Colletes gigas TaxID=935657 RepID=UPI001C9AA6F7|nr:chromatin assembly factor 1 subunit A-like [Colletes gigas]